MSEPRWLTLADALATLTPQQPATVFWRAIELDTLLGSELPRGRGIDVGCGDGRLIEVLRDHGLDWTLVGVDPDEAEIALARESGQYAAVHASSAAQIPEPDDSFDFAFSNSVLEHIPGVEDVLREVARVLTPGGTFVATVPGDGLHACLGGPGILGPLLGRERDEYLRRLDRRTAHVNLWSEEQWRTALEEAGLARVEATPYMSCGDVRRWERLSNWTGGIVHSLSGGDRHPLALTRSLGVSSGSARTRALRAPARAIVRRALRHYPPSSDAAAAGSGGLLLEATKDSR